MKCQRSRGVYRKEDSCEQAVASHEIEGAIWGDEGNCSVVLEARKPDALMELHIFKINSLILSPPALSLK